MLTAIGVRSAVPLLLSERRAKHLPRCQPRLFLEIFLALQRPLFVTRLVLGANQLVGSPAFLGDAIDIATIIPNRFRHMAALGLDRLEGPGLAVGSRQKLAEFGAIRAPAGDRMEPGPVAGRFQRFGNPGVQMRQRRIA